MKSTGITRKLDKLGRYSIPKELTTHMHIIEGDQMNLSITDRGIELDKIENRCIFCQSGEQLKDIQEKKICMVCIEEIK
jgi:transcriptional pleiotropic regulator of transition state genes